MLKMDFLGLKTLTVINDTVDLIEQTHEEEIVVEKVDDHVVEEIVQSDEESVEEVVEGSLLCTVGAI